MKDTIEKRAAIVSDWKNNKIPNILSKTEHRSQVLKDVPRIVVGRVNFTLISPDGYEQVSCDTK